MADNVENIDNDIPQIVSTDENEEAQSDDTQNVPVDGPDQAVVAIKKKVNEWLTKEKLLSGKMRDMCKEFIFPMIDDFARLNRDERVRLVEHAVIVQERFPEGRNYKEIGFEIDSDPALKKGGREQKAHFGAEIYAGFKSTRDHTGDEPWRRLGSREFKMHAECMKRVAPYYRHQDNFRENDTGPTSEEKDNKKYRIEHWKSTLTPKH